MDYQVSARKYRPGSFDSVIGQPHVVRTLLNAIASKRIAHAFLFSGTRGVGKTTVARILAKALNCEQAQAGAPCDVCVTCREIADGTSVDVVEIDGASNTSVDDVREIRENVKFMPFRGKYRVYIIDEVHMLSNSAFNALLKTLEEPPAHVVFIFATTELHKIPATILSRCQHYNFRRIAKVEIVERLRHVATQEGVTVEDRSLAALARASEGSMRDALSLLDQAVAFSGKTIAHQALEALLGTVPQEQVRAMVSAIRARDAGGAVRVVAHLLDQGHDLRAFCAELVEHLRHLLVATVVPSDRGPAALHGLVDLSDEEIREIQAEAQGLDSARLQTLFALFTEAEDRLRMSAQPRFVLEVAAIRAAEPESATAAAPRVERPDPAKLAVPGRPLAPPVPPAKPAPTPTLTTSPSRQNAPPPAAAKQAQASAPRPAVPPATVAKPATPPPPPLTLDWEAVVKEVEQVYPIVGAFLAQGSLVQAEGADVTVGFPATASTALARMQKDDALAQVSEVCGRMAGRPVRLRVVELSGDRLAAPTVAQARQARDRDNKQALLDRARAHPAVKQVLATFGAELADVRPLAPKKESDA